MEVKGIRCDIERIAFQLGLFANEFFSSVVLRNIHFGNDFLKTKSGFFKIVSCVSFYAMLQIELIRNNYAGISFGLTRTSSISMK